MPLSTVRPRDGVPRPEPGTWLLSSVVCRSHRRRWVWIATVGAAAACARTQINSTVAPEAVGQHYGRVLVVAEVADIGMRRTAEHAFQDVYGGDAVQFMASIDYFLPGREYSQEEINQFYANQGLDAALYIRPGASGVTDNAVTNSTCTAYDANGNCSQFSTTPGTGFDLPSLWANFSVAIHDVRRGHIVWSATEQTRGGWLAGHGKLFRSMASTTLGDLEREGLIARPSRTATPVQSAAAPPAQTAPDPSAPRVATAPTPTAASSHQLARDRNIVRALGDSSVPAANPTLPATTVLPGSRRRLAVVPTPHAGAAASPAASKTGNGDTVVASESIGAPTSDAAVGAGSEAFEAGRTFVARHEWSNAERWLREAIRLDGSQAAYPAELGQVFMVEQRWPEAEAAFGAAVLLDVDNPEYRRLLKDAQSH